MLSGSLARLSTGLKINNASDGPADLIISEKFRSQINGISKAIENTQNAISMLSTAEGALNEVNSLLTKMKGLALKAAQGGTQDTEEIAASQAEIDSAIESINTISRNTAFGSKNLLDGSLSVQTSEVDTNNVLVRIDRANFAGESKEVTVDVVTAATRASNTIDLTTQSTPGSLDNQQVLKVTGNRGSTTITFAANSTASDISEEINSQVGQTGVVATVANNIVTFESAKYGSSEFVTIEDVDGDNDLLSDVPESSTAYSFTDTTSGVNIATSDAYEGYTFNINVTTSLTNDTGTTVYVDSAQKTIQVVSGTGATNAGISDAINSALSTTVFSALDTSTVSLGEASIDATSSEPPILVKLNDDAAIDNFTLNFLIGTDTATTFNSSTSVLTIALNGDSATGILTANTLTDITNSIAAVTANGALIQSLFNFTVDTSSSMAGKYLATAATISHTATTIGAISTLTSFVKTSGTDGALEVNGVKTSANNLTYTFDNGNIRGAITIDEDFNTVGRSSTFALTGKGAFLQLGQKAQLSHQVGVAISSVAADQLGTGLYLDTNLDPTSSSVNSDSELYTTATLADITSGGEFDLASNAETAFDIIEKAINEVSVARSRLGALISNTLESNINSLGVAFENLTAAESRIRDVDFATETAQFTKAQILVQAGTSIAAQANVATQAALQLLG